MCSGMKSIPTALYVKSKGLFPIKLFIMYFFPKFILPRSNEISFVYPKVGFDALLSGISQYLVSSCRMSRFWVIRVIRQFELICAYDPEVLEKQKAVVYKETDLKIKKRNT